MDLNLLSSARNKFFSDFESYKIPEAIECPDIPYGVELPLKTYKNLVSYISGIFSYEPVYMDRIKFIPMNSPIVYEVIDYKGFMEKTKLNNKLSFYFQSTDFAHKVPLKFSDKMLLGGSNTYKPFDSSGIRAVSSYITANIDEIKELSDRYFKQRNLRGVVAFHWISLLPKGYTFYISDRDFYITVISFRNLKDVGYDYIGLLYVKL